MADTLARRDAAVREIQAARAAEEKAREHRYDAECKLERAKAVNAHALDVRFCPGR